MKTSYSKILLISILMLTSGSVWAAGTDSQKKDTKRMETQVGKPTKTAVVDRHRIITEDPTMLKDSYKEWQDLYAKMQETLKPSRKEITNLEDTIKKKYAELEALQKSGVSSREAIAKKYQEEAYPHERQYQAQIEQYQRYAQEEFRKAEAIIAPKLKVANEAIAKQQGWDKVDYADLVAYVDKSFDITDAVLRFLNAQYDAEHAKKKTDQKN